MTYFRAWPRGRIGLLWVWVFCALLACDRAAGDEPTIFRGSLIPAWFDGPDDYKRYNVDLMCQDMDLVDELDLGRWKTFVHKRHDEGKLFFAEMSPITHTDEMLEYTMSKSGLLHAACLDLDLKPIPIPWMVGHGYKGKTPPFLCSNHPAFRAFLRQQVYMFEEIGSDGIMVDDAGGTFFAYSRGGCFCEYCMKGFRQYLRAKYSRQQLQKGGIADLDSFNYREFVLRHTADSATYRKDRSRIPWTEDFRDFLLQSDVALFTSLHRMAGKLRGARVPFGWDNVDFGGSRAPYYPILDVFYSEINYQNFAVTGRGPDEVFPPSIIMLNKAADALGKWYTPTPAPRSWQAIMEKNLTGLLQQWIAFTYANGGPMRYPRKGWCFSETSPWYYPPQKEFEPLYDFVRHHRELFDGYEAAAQVGVLFTQSRNGGRAKYYTPLKRVCATLVGHNVPFGFAVAGDELLSRRLRGDEVDHFQLMLIPEPIRLIDGQDKIVAEWKRAGRARAVAKAEDLESILSGRISPWCKVESDHRMWLFPRQRRAEGKVTTVCHLVNPRHGPHPNEVRPQHDVRVFLDDALCHGGSVRRITYYTPGEAAQELVFKQRDRGVEVTVPSIELWGILKIEPLTRRGDPSRRGAPTSKNGKPSS